MNNKIVYGFLMCLDRLLEFTAMEGEAFIEIQELKKLMFKVTGRE